MNIKYFVLAFALLAFEANADSSLDAAIGGGLGGAVGAVIGHEVAGRDGAIIGGAIGAASGVAVNTDGDSGKSMPKVSAKHKVGHPHGYHCPPGQAKKGRC
jgi:hypothetical protein